MSYGLLSPRVDFVFKKIFGNEQHPNILISFLNAVLNQKDVITSVKILNTDIDKEHIDDKYSRLDIKATTNNKEHINIEIQVKNEYNMVKRSMYYWSKMYEGQIIEGDDYDKLARTVCINILDFKCLKNDRFHNFYRLKEVETNEELTDIQELHFIELPKYKGVSEDEDISNMLEVWTTFIKNPESKVIERLETSKEEIKDAKYELLRISASSKERELYERRKESLLNKVSALKNAEEKGERNKTVEIARNLLDILDNETISLKTGLSVDEVQELRDDIN
ncbi:MAG: Rpn family recombination-promoting nuclease/putative transposase [Paraclostridium sp.]